MIGMTFGSFLTLFIISLVVSVVMHYLVRYRVAAGFDGFLGKLAIGWLGGWIGSPIFGYWPETVNVGPVYIIPALLGSLATVFGITFLIKLKGAKS